MNSPASAWKQYKALCSPTVGRNHATLPSHQGEVVRLPGTFGYVLPEALLAVLRGWIERQRQDFAYYFLTETAPNIAECDFLISVRELTAEKLSELNPNLESVVTAVDFAWAVHVDHDGVATAVGPRNLLAALHRAAGAGHSGTPSR